MVEPECDTRFCDINIIIFSLFLVFRFEYVAYKFYKIQQEEMSRLITQVLCFSYVVLFLINFINAWANFEITYVSYENPSSKTADGKCCDELSRCRSNCTNVFVICLKDIKSTICGINGFTSKVFVGDYLTFKKEDETGIRNPHAFFLLTTPKKISLNFSVYTNATNKLIAEFYNEVQLNATPFDVIKRERLNFLYTGTAGNNKTLAIKASLNCGKGYLLPDCKIKCERKDDKLGHYKCDNWGKICLPGWTDVSKNCTIPLKLSSSSSFLASKVSPIIFSTSSSRLFSTLTHKPLATVVAPPETHSLSITSSEIRTGSHYTTSYSGHASSSASVLPTTVTLPTGVPVIKERKTLMWTIVGIVIALAVIVLLVLMILKNRNRKHRVLHLTHGESVEMKKDKDEQEIAENVVELPAVEILEK
ncbi:uncharacterized protein LOC130614507 isoform X1 [Hydractinia symbiolongicarpus]|uniref:uncharacterized protein LOC130614507 isoform X1 n=1 Tax=Hydractinia symbiolongicarpus TaxID=13093 RepID=UPI002550F28A|nr:uncharacterized protein LOC130614507 isoform X1 [Hydractinia symbiolongicarpus]